METRYSPEQLALYFDRIHFPTDQHPEDSLDLLNEMIQRHLATIPFETLSLHYSLDGDVSLDATELFNKIITRGRGGYCLELNTFFGVILKSMGFQVVGVICRISMASRGVYDGSWRAMSHMANLVLLNDGRYLVDVGYGVDGPVCALQLVSGDICPGMMGQQLKLEQKTLIQHQDKEQKAWVYSQRRGTETWQDVYHFLDVEFFLPDFEVLNHFAMTKSLWSTTVVAQKFVFGSGKTLAGTTLLVRDNIRFDNGLAQARAPTLKLDNEDERLKALEKYFGIGLSQEERLAIQDKASSLDISSKSA